MYCTPLFNTPYYNHILFCLLTLLVISEYTMMDEDKVADNEMLQDLQILPKGGKEVCKDT